MLFVVGALLVVEVMMVVVVDGRWWEIGACERAGLQAGNMTGPIAKIRKSMSSSFGLDRCR